MLAQFGLPDDPGADDHSVVIVVSSQKMVRIVLDMVECTVSCVLGFHVIGQFESWS